MPAVGCGVSPRPTYGTRDLVYTKKKKEKNYYMAERWHKPIIQAHEMLRQEDCCWVA